MDNQRQGTFFSRMIARLFGNPDSMGLEHRVLNAMTFLATVTAVVSTVANILLGLPMIMTVLTVLCIVAGTMCYLVARRTRKWRKVTIPLFSVFLLLLAATWVTQAGTMGGIGYYFFLVVIAAIVLYRKGLVLIAAVICVLVFLEFFFPAWILTYPAPEQRFPDVVVSLMLCLSITAAMVYVIYNEYQRERDTAVSLLKQATREKENAERMTEEKQRLLSIVCHDIANALTVIGHTVSLMKQEDGTDGQSDPKHLHRLIFAAGNIKEIISSVRTLEAVRLGTMSLDLKPVSLKDIFEKSGHLFLEKLARRRIRLEYPPGAQMDIEVLAEPMILSNHVLNNLISNAIKFSYNDSSIIIDVSDCGETVGIAVRDSGIGIPESMMPHLFDPLVKTTRPGLDDEPGTGFGLMAVRSFVELFGGSVEVQSIPETVSETDHGTVVTVCLRKAGAGLIEK